MIVTRDAKPWIRAVRSSHDRLTAIVEPLGPDQVTGPSMAEEWTIAQVLSHLGSQAEIFAAFLDAAIDGGEPPGPESFPPVWDAWNGRSASDQVKDSLAANAAFVDRVEALSEAQLETLTFAMFGMNADFVRFIQMRLSEHAVHTWDVAAALDPEATVSADAVALLIDSVAELARRAGKTEGGPVRVRMVTSDPARDVTLAVDDAVEITDWDGGKTDGVVRLPAEAMVRLVYGRLRPGHVAGIEVEGDVTLDRLRAVFPGI
jgi:uncharacterized protein (TIGR03083 family)